ncbi:MAG: GNAT family N-acetyltransferase [Muribaculaceae bacterium]|nr:GNAT family N-acetyltransferase [Muribaculaceae bacterium]
MGIIFRQGVVTDVPAVMEIIDAAVDRMLREGKQQWDESYPAVEHIMEDLRLGTGHVLVDDGHVVAYGAIVLTGEPAYDDIEDGDWLTDGSQYITVHRLAVAADMHGRGLARRFIDIACDLAAARGIGSMRIDTNYDNGRMLRLLEGCGFERCGIVRYEKGERIAFEKLI